MRNRLGVICTGILLFADVGCRRGSRAKVDTLVDDVPPVVASGQIAVLHLSALQPVIALGEHPEFILALGNTSRQRLFVNKRLSLNDESEPGPFRDIWLRVLGPDGIAVKYSTATNVGFASVDDYTLLLPGDKIEKVMAVDEFELEQPGAYLFKAWYRDGSITPPPAPSGSIRLAEELQSEPVKIEVVKRK
jgi:hypothetical protein